LASGAIIALLMLPCSSVLAHHSFSAEYNITQPIELKGTVTSVEWTNPHAFVTIAVTDTDGKIKEWRGEGGALSLLLDSGWTPEMLQQIARSKSIVVVSGYRARDGAGPANGMWVKAIELPDGRKLVFN
jgi:Family of unknown function (DUF6152)